MAEVEDPYERGREACARRAWLEAFDLLSRADSESALGADDLELLATAAYMIGRDDDYAACLERAHRLHLEQGRGLRGVRCAFWLGVSFLLRGETSLATGWFARAERMLGREEGDCVERGYLLLPALLEQVAAGDAASAYAIAGEAAEIGERFGDADLVAMVVQEQGHALIRQGRAEEGLRLLDETMVAVIAGELSPIVTGLVYCNTIAFCQSVYQARRARDWTAALTQWCERQPEMVTHTGLCLVHRAEVLQLGGAWPDALEEARRAERRLAERSDEAAAGYACYRQGEVHRLRGELGAAEDAYREAGRFGREPQPGLALLRLAQGRPGPAAATIRRLVAETGEPVALAALLPAYVEIMLAVGEIDEARRACGELAAISDGFKSELLDAVTAQAQGAVALMEGDAPAGLVSLRQALLAWQDLGVPYETARTRVLVALACRALGDEDAAALELETARAVFEELGAAPDMERAATLAARPPARDSHGLTARELEVLLLVATGRTNKEIAARLVLSERTVDRHVSNILAKVGASSRAAATAYAYEHQLI